MRTLAAVACMVVALSASAQQERLNAFHVFVANPSYTSSESSGTNWGGAIGVAYQRRFASVWGLEVAVARDTHHSSYASFDRDGNVVASGSSRWTSTPVDLAALYHFPNQSSWKPYLGVDVRYVDAPRNAVENTRFVYGIEGGVVWQFGRTVGVRFDGKVLAGDSPVWVDTFNAGIGLSWRF